MPAASQVTREQMRARLVRYGELVPCRTAFIDTRTPGSESKENFTIIGPGVAENPDQHVHIREPHGFNIGAARQPPGCVNSQHSHETAEVFWIHSGRWRFMTGEHGEDGEVVLERGDTISIPIHVFRGFENVGGGEGFMFAALGGDDPGRVTWAPYVFDDARRYGLVLLESGRLIDTAAGEAVPDDEPVMPATTAGAGCRTDAPEQRRPAIMRGALSRYQRRRRFNPGPKRVRWQRQRASHHRPMQSTRGRPASPSCLGARLPPAPPQVRSGCPFAGAFPCRRGSLDDPRRPPPDHLGLRIPGPRPRRRTHRPHRTRTRDRKPERRPCRGLRRPRR